MRGSSSCAVGLSALLLLGSTDARAGEASDRECIEAADRAQALRDEGHYSSARKELVVCSRPTCPAVIERDCTVWLVDLDRAMPTIVVRSRRPEARSARVFVDGALFVDGLDGQPKPIDPGEHVFRFEVPEEPPTEEKLVIFAAEHERVVDVPAPVTADPPTAETEPAVERGTPLTPEPEPEPSPTVAPTSGTRTLAYVLGGAGIVGLGIGVGFGLKAKSTYDSASSAERCPTGPTSCDEQGIAGGRDAHSEATIATVATIAGGALVAGGLVLFLTSRSSPPVTLQTAALPGGAAIRGAVAW